MLSWSLLNAMARDTPVLASDTAPVREVIRDGETGLLVPFHDIDRWCERANAMLDDPAAHRPLGRAASALVRDRFSLEVCLPKMLKLYSSVTNRRPTRTGAFAQTAVAIG